MRVTNVKLKKLEDRGKLKAVGSVTFDDVFVVSNVAIVEGANGMFVSMPSRKREDGKYQNIAFPIKPDLREEITEAFLSAYEKEEQEAEKEVSADE